MRAHRTALLLAPFALLAPTLAGQEIPAPRPLPPSPEAGEKDAAYRANRAVLTKALATLTGSKGYRFAGRITFPGTKEPQQPGNPRAGRIIFGGLGGRTVGETIKGSVFADGLTTFTLDGTGKGAGRGGGLLYYRGTDKRWRPRLGTDLAGNKLWWRPDPTALLQEVAQLLAAGKPIQEVALERGEVKRIGLRHLREYRITLTGKRAGDLLQAGFLPDPLKVPARGNNMVFRTITSSMSGPVLPTDLKYRFSLWLDVRTKTVHKLQILASGKPNANNPFGRGAVIRLGGGGGGGFQQGQEDKGPRQVSLVIDLKDYGKPDWSTRTAGLEKRLRLKHLAAPEPAPKKKVL